MIIVRKATENDLESIVKIARECLSDVMTAYHSQAVIAKYLQHQNIDEYRTQLGWKDIFIAETNNVITGTGALANFGTPDKPKFSVSNCYVMAAFHRQGIGSMILETIISLAKSKDAAILHCPSSINGIPFYEKSGFTVDEVQNDLEDEITWMSMILT